MTTLVNVDGKLGSESDPLLSPLDQGFLFGASVYETVRTYGGRVFLLGRHLERLRESAKALDITLDVSDEELAARVRETIVAAGNPESSIRIVVSAGVGAIDYRAGSAPKPTVVVIVRPLPEYPESLYREGARAVFVKMMRATRGGLDPRIKSSNLLTNLSALREAQRKKAYEAIMLNPDGEVAEGSMSNVFLVSKGVVRTPPISAGILEGITRELVIEVAREAGYRVEERGFKPDDLLRADEVFITASARQIVPIVQVDKARIGNGKPGPVTRTLITAYKDRVRALINEKE
ncbi:MAG TPA: aminotransferase class IV [Vicinamibacteria bacterium]|jgi:branched-chain amino acid aminotransferase